MSEYIEIDVLTFLCQLLQLCYKNAQSLIILGGGAIMKTNMEVYPYIKIK